MNNSNALAEIQSKYPNCNLLLPAATSVQINPFYKCSVMEVVADTAPNSGDIFSVGKVKTGEDRNGKAVYEEVYSPAKPLLMKLATAAGIQFHPEYTTVTRENTNTCAKLISNEIYYDASEDRRNTYVRDRNPWTAGCV